MDFEVVYEPVKPAMSWEQFNKFHDHVFRFPTIHLEEPRETVIDGRLYVRGVPGWEPPKDYGLRPAPFLRPF